MKRLSRSAVLAAAFLGAGIQFVRPARTNPPATAADTLAAHLPVPPEVQRILDRACRDCHSNETRWPWYSQVAPVSWWVIEHVNHGRSHFNYSQWGHYDRPRRGSLLDQTCALAKGGDMPLGSYLLMHTSARLSAQDVDVLCRWTKMVPR
jgi:hypothetical protein